MTVSTTDGTRSISLPRARLVDGELCFNRQSEADRALDLGIFLLGVPDDIDVAPGLKLCRSFYKPATDPADRYRGHRENGHPQSQLGYSDRPNQVEQLQIESWHWDKYLPAEVVEMLERMRQLTIEALYGVFAMVGVPSRDWETITGGARENRAWCHTTVNHFRTEISDHVGIVEHTDAGFITTLYNDQPGYELLLDGEWVPADFEPSCFVINMGDAIEILTRRMERPVTAVIHQVPELPHDRPGGDRSSFTCYIGPRYDMPLYQYTPEGVLEEHIGFREFSVEKAKRLGYEFHPRI